MATVERSRSRRRAEYEPAPRRKRKSHAFRNFCLAVLVLLVAAVYFAPLIVAKTPLRNWLLQTAVAPQGSITLGSASLGWFSPIAAEKLEVRDAAGQIVVAVDSFSSDKQLIAMLLDVTDFGRLHVVRPNVHLVARQHDTNLEEVFASLLNAEGGSSATMQLDVTEGSLLVDDTVSGREYKVENLAVDCTLGDSAHGIALALSGAIPSEREAARFQVDLQATPSSETNAALANGRVNCQTTALPLDVLDPLLRRTVDEAKLSGRLSAEMTGSWGNMAKAGEASVNGQVVLTNLVFAASALGTDEVRLDRVEMPCHIVQHGDLVEVSELAVKCELGELALNGTAKVSDFSAENQLAELARENYEVKGHVDLARLARMLPATLRIRQGTEITQGEVSLVGTAKRLQSGMSWTGRLDASQLAAKAKGRPIVWDNPLAIQFSVHESDKGFNIDRAVCTSSFLQINGAGSLDDLSASADFDLAQLIAELHQFADFGELKLAGQGRARLELKRAAQNQFSADAEFQARGFQWITGQSRPWTEDNLVARMSLAGQLEGQSLKRVEQCALVVESGGDHLETRLREPIVDPFAASWPMACQWRGQLAAWMPRLESCAGLTGWDLAGQGSLDATLKASAKAVELENAKTDFANLHVHGQGWHIDEPTVSATAQGKWDRTGNRVELTGARLSAGTATATINRAVLRATDAGWVLDDGTVHAEGQLAQLARWRQDPRAPAAWQISGQLTADAQLKHSIDASEALIDAAVDRLQIVDTTPAAPGSAKPAAWQERRITLSARGNFQHAAEQLKLAKLQVASDALRCDAAGTIPMSARGGDIDLKGTVGYDWQQLAPVWQPYLGKGFQIAGHETRDFAISGQLTGYPTSADAWAKVRGEAAVGWTGMNVYGLTVGKGEIVPQLADGQVTTKPIDFEVSKGRLTVTPVARLSPAPAELFLAKGPLLTDVQLSPEICAQGMRFVAPLLADATVAEGKFSISLDGGRVPLGDATMADLGGRMSMLGQAKPGPLAQEFVGLIKEVLTIVQRGQLPNLQGLDGSLVSVDSPNVEFRMVNRRVYHRGLTIKVAGIPITTQGSVGLDESLALVAELPLQARLLGVDLSLGKLEGQTLKIPIDGTLKKPRLDRRALADLPLQLIENAARDVLIDGLNKGLDRLFPGQK